MNDARERQTNGHALGDVARDVMDHASIIVRDRIELTRLEAQRYAAHVKKDVAPRAALTAAVVVCGGLAGLMALIAVFLGLVSALGSVAWSFVIYALVFAVVTAALAGFRAQPPRAPRAEDIERRFPIVKAHEHEPAHALVRQETPEEHHKIVVEAGREIRGG
jgi:hypothetical protein